MTTMRHLAERPTPPLLALRGLSKAFGGVQALRDVALTVEPGEVHGLLGENGSGKSTLIKILAGYHSPDSGELQIGGEPVKLPLQPGQFRDLGFDFVHQDLALVPSLSVVENLRIGELAAPRRRGYVSWRKERREAQQVFARYGLKLDPKVRVADLGAVERALLAIVRAIEGLHAREIAEQSHKPLLVLDEPTAFLPKEGVDELFSLIRQIASTGASVLFVSHDLDEILEITDRVTVLRDGRVVGTVATDETDESQLVELIIGRRLDVMNSRRQDAIGGTAVSVEALVGERLNETSLELRRGEVVGVTGLAGSGFEEIPYLLFGAHAARNGTLSLDGTTFDLRSMTPARAVQVGCALIPADRQHDGSVLSLAVVDNLSIQVLDDYVRWMKLQRRRMVRDARDLMAKFDIRPGNPSGVYSSLSGGNQQKALLARWLRVQPMLLLLHEPTQGVDVGARQQIFALIREAATEGMAVICASSDYEQLSDVCDRVIVFGRTSIFSELEGDAVTKERIAEQCYNSTTLQDTLVEDT